MSATSPDVIDSTVQQTNLWLQAIAQELGSEDRRRAYRALRGTLHALRDYLIIDEAAQLAAQLPLLVRGIYYEGWDPSRVPVDGRDREDFLRRVASACARAEPDVDPERTARAVLRVLSANISTGEANQARQLLPSDVQELGDQVSGDGRPR